MLFIISLSDVVSLLRETSTFFGEHCEVVVLSNEKQTDGCSEKVWAEGGS